MEFETGKNIFEYLLRFFTTSVYLAPVAMVTVSGYQVPLNLPLNALPLSPTPLYTTEIHC